MSKVITESVKRQAKIAADRYDRNYLYDVVANSEAMPRLREVATLAIVLQADQGLDAGMGLSL